MLWLLKKQVSWPLVFPFSLHGEKKQNDDPRVLQTHQTGSVNHSKMGDKSVKSPRTGTKLVESPELGVATEAISVYGTSRPSLGGNSRNFAPQQPMGSFAA